MNIKLILVASFSLLLSARSLAQQGCTDPYATNYNPSATINDGSCMYAVTHDTPVLRTTLPNTLTETSGLSWIDGKLWTHNDSGNPNTLFSIDTTDGHVLQMVYVDNYSNVDWEDITADSDYIYIGDIGNNTGDRTDLKILKIAKADIGLDTAVHVNAQAILYSYSDQTNFTPTQFTNFDCEALISIGDSLYVFTKDRLDNKTRVYSIPKVPGTYSVDPYTSYNVNGLITAASYNAATNEIVLVGYTLLKTNSFLWFLNDFNTNMFFSGNKRRIEIGGSSEWQTEGIAFIDSSRYFISNETATVNASLFIGDKSWPGSLGLRQTYTSEAQPEMYPNPFTNVLNIDQVSSKTNYTIIDVLGRSVATGSLKPGHNSISLDKLGRGIYMMKLKDANGKNTLSKIVKE